jgi:hypothetical protein
MDINVVPSNIAPAQKVKERELDLLSTNLI